MKYIPAGFRQLFHILYLENTWEYRGQRLFRAEKLYTARNYQIFLDVFLKNFPKYVYFCPFRGKEVITAPLESVSRIYVPDRCLRDIGELKKKDDLHLTTLELVDFLSSESDIDMRDFGVHGSVALDMHTAKSDIDLVVYGSHNFRKLETTISKLVEAEKLRYIFNNRLDAVRRYKGKYKNRVFMYNAVRKSEEINSKYGAEKYAPISPVRFRCRIKDDREAMFRPAIYRIEDYRPTDEISTLSDDKIPDFVVSMIGCYRNVARTGDEISVNGSLERVENIKSGEVFHQVVVGTGTDEDERIWPI